MKGTFGSTGNIYDAADASTFVKGRKGLSGLMVLGGASSDGAADLVVSTDAGVTWISEGTYDGGTVKKIEFPDPNALYSFNCTTYTNPFTFEASGY